MKAKKIFFIILIILYIFSGNLFSQVRKLGEKEKEIDKQKEVEQIIKQQEENRYTMFKGILQLLEIGSSIGNNQGQGLENASSVLNSIRVKNNTFSDPLDIQTYKLENYEIFNQRRTTKKLNPGHYIKYTIGFNRDRFFTIDVQRNAMFQELREFNGSLGTNILDSMKTFNTRYTIKGGIGPLNYLDKKSEEFALGYEIVRNRGPFSSITFKLPKTAIIEGNITEQEPFREITSYGTVQYKTHAYFFEYSFLGNDWLFKFFYGESKFMEEHFYMYYKFHLQQIYGKLTFSTINSNRVKSINDPDYNQNFEKFLFQYVLFQNNFPTELIISNMGSYFNPEEMIAFRKDIRRDYFARFEMGWVIKFTENFGIRFGGFYAYLFENKSIEPVGFYYRDGKILYDIRGLKLTTADKTTKLGLYGSSAAIIFRF
ncbi:MAG: hypothetical protein KatS3mg129_2082 [Leptospiraceae bacterium]|nr:MAG: hypothetical protein KatS3mg129_2082 [Leptospiraceae bacterium]